MSMQTWWLSFCDGTRPKGQRFLGVAIVDVTQADADAIHDEVVARRLLNGLTDPVEPDVDWMAAAVRKAHRTGCNPGGEVQSARIDEAPLFPEMGPKYPRHRLLSRAELEAIEPVVS